jgi:hypothetical protein
MEKAFIVGVILSIICTYIVIFRKAHNRALEEELFADKTIVSKDSVTALELFFDSLMDSSSEAERIRKTQEAARIVIKEKKKFGTIGLSLADVRALKEIK